MFHRVRHFQYRPGEKPTFSIEALALFEMSFTVFANQTP